MSAGFDVAGEIFWGTNGSIEVFVETMGTLAAQSFGPDEPLAVFLRAELEVFFPGKVVALDAFVQGADDRRRLLQLLDDATEQLLSGDTFTAFGRSWVRTTIAALRAKLVQLDQAIADP